MPYDDPDAGDPMTLHGVLMETEDDGAMREMAKCFIEEFARLGFDAGRISKLFTNPGYAGPFLAYQTLGEEAICAFIDEQMSLRNHSLGATGSGSGATGSLPARASVGTGNLGTGGQAASGTQHRPNGTHCRASGTQHGKNDRISLPVLDR